MKEKGVKSGAKSEQQQNNTIYRTRIAGIGAISSHCKDWCNEFAINARHVCLVYPIMTQHSNESTEKCCSLGY
jgi:hypothetical protein